MYVLLIGNHLSLHVYKHYVEQLCTCTCMFDNSVFCTIACVLVECVYTCTCMCLLVYIKNDLHLCNVANVGILHTIAYPA